jgi:hypothetical protein
MPDLSFQVENVEAVPFAAAPTLAFKLRIDQVGAPVPIHSVMLRCQVRIEPAKRRYAAEEQERLLDLFDTPDHWSQSLRPLLWTHASAFVPPFSDTATIDLPVPCTFDFNVGATKYFYALEEGEVPLTFLFSGTIFYELGDVGLQVAQIPWEKEAPFRLPVGVWKEMMDRYYPNSAWLCLRRDVFDRLYRYKSEQRLPTWEQAMDALLSPARPPDWESTVHELRHRSMSDEYLGSE